MQYSRLEKTIALLVSVLAISVLISYVVLAWTEPTVLPPGGNVPAPVNVGSSAQGKLGSLGVGISTPVSRFHIKDGQTWGSDLSIDATGVAGGRRWMLISTGGTAAEGQGKFLIRDNNAGIVRLTIDTAGRVGIGTFTPGYMLDVAGGVNVSGVYYRAGTAGISSSCPAGQTFSGLTSSGGIITSVGSCTSTGGVAVNYWTQVAPNLLYPNNTAWNVGIGTTGPVAKLDVRGRTYINPQPGFIASPTIDLAIGDTDTGLGWISDGNLAVYTNNAERMRITSNGRVGIGTTSPLAKMEVSNSNEANGLRVTTNFSLGPDSWGVTGEATGGTSNNWGGGFGAYGAPNRNIGVYGLAHGDAGTKYALYGAATGAGTNWGLYVESGNAYIGGNLRVTGLVNCNTIDTDASGNLFCGTDETGGAGGLTGTGAANKVAFWTSGTNLSNNANFHWDNTNQRLGIGTATPGSTLDVKGGIWLGGGTWKIGGISGAVSNYIEYTGTPMNIILPDTGTINMIGSGGGAVNLSVSGKITGQRIVLGGADDFSQIGVSSLASVSSGWSEGGRFDARSSGAGSTATGVVGDARNAETNYALHAWASGGTTNWGLFVEQGMSFLSGYTGIGIPFGTKPAYPLDVGGNTHISGQLRTEGSLGLGGAWSAYRLTLPNTAGFGGTGIANAWITYSSKRWKENITKIDNALEKVLALEGVEFDWKKEQGGKHDIGLIAEDVGKVIPDVVYYEDENKEYATGLNYDGLVAVLIEAIKTQQTQIDQLKSEISALKK
jgi:hypothetical protein